MHFIFDKTLGLYSILYKKMGELTRLITKECGINVADLTQRAIQLTGYKFRAGQKGGGARLPRPLLDPPLRYRP